MNDRAARCLTELRTLVRQAFTLDAGSSSTYKRYEVEIEFMPGVSEVWIGAITFNNNSRVTYSNQYIAKNMTLAPNIPTQAEVDGAQNDAIKSLERAKEVSTAFQEEQRKVNRTVQAQQWLHQDMLELLDIRTPKIYGWPAGYSHDNGYKTINCLLYTSDAADE